MQCVRQLLLEGEGIFPEFCSGFRKIFPKTVLLTGWRKPPCSTLVAHCFLSINRLRLPSLNLYKIVIHEAQRLRALENLEAHREEEAGQQHLRILAEIMKLRRLCCNPTLILPEAGVASSKLRVFIKTPRELLENNLKALIFSQFVDHLRILGAYLDEQKISYQYLDGSTPIAQRKERMGFEVPWNQRVRLWIC